MTALQGKRYKVGKDSSFKAETIGTPVAACFFKKKTGMCVTVLQGTGYRDIYLLAIDIKKLTSTGICLIDVLFLLRLMATVN